MCQKWTSFIKDFYPEKALKVSFLYRFVLQFFFKNLIYFSNKNSIITYRKSSQFQICKKIHQLCRTLVIQMGISLHSSTIDGWCPFCSSNASAQYSSSRADFPMKRNGQLLTNRSVVPLYLKGLFVNLHGNKTLSFVFHCLSWKKVKGSLFEEKQELNISS